MHLPSRLRRHLDGPPFALPGALDRWSERWWRLTPRRRALLAGVIVLGALLAANAWVDHVQRRWGGPARRALVAVDHTVVGERPHLRAVLLPPAMVPPDAPQRVDGEQRLALALPRGAVLTRAHLSPRGAAVGLDAHLRAVALPVPAGLELRPGSTVDVWVLRPDPGGSRLVARGRPVLRVGEDDESVALVGLSTPEVAAAMRGLAGDAVVLTQAPT